MKRGCVFGVVLCGALVAAYYIALTPYLEWPGNLIAAGLAGLFAAIFLSGIFGVFRATRDARRLRNMGKQTVGMLKDGETVAVTGTMRPIEAPLQAPFSGTPCVAYAYDIIHASDLDTPRGGTDTSEVHEISGLALAPSIIDTPTGGVRLLSFAMLDQFPQRTENNGAARARAALYIEQTTFKPMGVTKVFNAIAALKEALTDEDGAVRMDWRMNPDEILLGQATLRERLVGVGQQVSAIGRYSADRHGLIADGVTSPIQLRPGDAQSAQRSMMRQAYATLGRGAALFAVSQAVLAFVLYMSETRYQRVSSDEQERLLRIAVQNHDTDEVRRLFKRGVNPNIHSSGSATVLHDLRDVNMVRLLTKAGADPNLTDQYGSTPLMLAARAGRDDVVAALLEGGASVNFARPNGSTALSEAIEGERADVITRLQAAGARSDLVTAGNGRPLPADGGEPMETVRAYLKAVHARDIPGLYAAYVPHEKGLFESTDFDLWQRIRPQAPVFVAGFTNGSIATLAIGGPTISRARYIWHYQLVYKGEVWRILREWDTTLTKTPSPAPSASPVERSSEPLERSRVR